jgi:hypothetical protein
MKARKQLYGWVLGLALIAWIPVARAQQPDQGPEVSEPKTTSPAGEGAAVPAGKVDIAPSNPSVTSVEPWGELSRPTRNYFRPSFSIYLGGDTNPYSSSSKQLQPEGISQFTGRLEAHRLGNLNELVFTYEGNATLYAQRHDLNSNSHSMDIAEKFYGRRWTLLMDDQLIYSPETLFSSSGFNGWTAMYDNFGTLSTQSILTGRTQRIENRVTSELQYQASRRSALTLSGSYDILRFPDVGFVDSNTASLQFGLSRLITPRNTLGVVYAGSVLWFAQQPLRVQNHALQLAFGRLLRKRLAFRISGGPQVSLFANTSQVNPLDNVSGDVQPLLSASIQSSLNYSIPRGYLRLAYAQDISSGGGVFLGAQSHQARVELGRQLFRAWSATWKGAYAYNRRLEATATTGIQYTFNTWEVGAALERPVGRYTRVSLTYDLSQQQTQLTGLAVGRRQQFGIRFDFGFQPIQVR